MTNEEKEILVKALCCLIPYGVKVECSTLGTFTLVGVYKDSYGNYRVFTDCEEEGKCNNFPIEAIKPYLRPLSSITDEERETVHNAFQVMGQKAVDAIKYNLNNNTNIPFVSYDVQNVLEHKLFDTFGLLPNLAIEMPKNMYK